MATQLFARSYLGLWASTHLGTNNTKLDESNSGWYTSALSTTGGSTAVQYYANTVTGATSGIEPTTQTGAGSYPLEWISEPLDQDVTISGTVTFNMYMHESGMSANVGAQCVIERLDSQGGIVSTIVNSEQGSEIPTTNPPTAARNWTATPTSTNMLKGDRIRVRFAGNDGGGTMGSGFTFSVWVNGGSGQNGDTYVSFTETFGFETTTPAGTQLFLTDTAGPAVGAAIEKEMWTSRGDGVNSIVRGCANGWTAPLQWTDTDGGTVVEWYSRQLQAFTLADLVRCNLRALESSTTANCSIRAEIAVCDNDGTNVTVWGAGNWNDSSANGGGELTTTEAAYTIYVSGDDLSVASGQRLRLRVYIDDTSSFSMVSASTTATLYYDGTSAGASGDSWIQLTQSVSEFTAGKAPSSPQLPFNLLAM